MMTPRHFARRTILGTASLLMLVPGLALASPAIDFVASFGSELTHILNGSVSLEQKRKDILPLLKKNVDIPAIGKYCLGRYWRHATPEQQKRYLQLFDSVLLNAVTMRIGSYQNVTLRITGSTSSPSGEKVDLVVSRPKQPDVNMIVVVNGTPPKVVDLYGEGASMRMTQRSDYVAYLNRHNGDIQTLIDALQHQVDVNRATAQ